MKAKKDLYEWHKYLMDLGAIISDDGRIRFPRPNKELERMRFAKENRNCPILSIYNNGRNIFFGWGLNSLIGYYNVPWQWISYREFCMGRRVTIIEKDFNNKTHAIEVFIKALGHVGSCARIKIGALETDKEIIRFNKYKIHKNCILFVALRKNTSPKFLQVFQPLPALLATPDFVNRLKYDV
jgi:hypothetical protein